MQSLSAIFQCRWKYLVVFVVAVMISIGFCNTSVGDFRSVKFLVPFIILVVFIQLLLIELLEYCLCSKGRLVYFENLIQLQDSRKMVIFLLMSWSVYLIAYFPGVLSFDTSFQLVQFFGNPSRGIFPMTEHALFTDHHPIFTTFIMGSAISLLHSFFSYNFSLWFVCILMALMQSMLITWQLRLLSSVINNTKLITLLFLFYCICPVFGYLCCLPCKDSIFCICLLGFLNTWISLYVKSPSRETFFFFFVFALLCALSKKTTVYVFLLLSIALLFVKIPSKRRVLITLLSIICLVQIVIPSFLFPLFSISKGSIIETLGPLYQCTARYCKEFPDDVTREEEQIIDSMLGYDGLGDRYDYRLADNVIHYWAGVDQWPSFDKVKAYLNVFIKQGLRHPDAYIRAFLSQESGWFSFDEHLFFPEGTGSLLVSTNNGHPSFDRPPVFQSTSFGLHTALDLIASLPVVGLLFRPVSYLILIILVLINYVASYKGDCVHSNPLVLWLCLPILCMIPFLLLSPTSMVSTNMEAVRYFLPFVYSVPILFVVSLNSGSATMV